MVPAYLILPGLSAALEFLNFDNDTVNASSFFKLPAYRAKTFTYVRFVQKRSFEPDPGKPSKTSISNETTNKDE